MNPTALIVSYILILAGAILYVVQKRKSQGARGFKSFVTPISFFGVSVIAFTVALTGKGGIFGMSAIVVLLLIGAFYTKYLPAPKEERR